MKVYVDGYLLLKRKRMSVRDFYEKEVNLSIPVSHDPNEIGWGLVLKNEEQVDKSKPEDEIFKDWFSEEDFNERLYMEGEE